MKRILVFDFILSGHHLEYIHHLYQKAIVSSDEYYFCLPDDFIDVKNKMDWPSSSNVYFHLFPHISEDYSPLMKSLILCKQVRKCCQEFQVSHAFFISLMSFLPFLPFFIPRGIKVSGIIYLIYLYRWKSEKLRHKALDICKYLLLSKSSCFNKVFILNDKVAAYKFNRIYHTKKFLFIPDPFVPIGIQMIDDAFSSLKDSSDIVYLHFGALSKRKGTLKIMNSLLIMDKTQLRNKTFLFLGKIQSDIYDEFYSLLASLKDRVKIIHYDEFCSFSIIASACQVADYLLLPYENVESSSGVIGYAAQFNTPVIAPSSGLLGKLVKRFSLGRTYDDKFDTAFENCIKQTSKQHEIVSQKYLKTNTIDAFLTSISFD